MEEVQKLNARKSGVELLRIIAIFLICLNHAIQTSESFLDYGNLTFGIVTLKILRYSGQIGNILFVICTSWFLVDSKKLKVEKVLKILLDSTIISILIFLGFVLCGYQFSFQEVIQQLLPDLFSNMWFIPVYVVFYLIHPLLNSAIDGMNKKTHFYFCLTVLGILGFLGFIGWGGEIINAFVGFCIVYFVIAFIKKYCKDFYENRKLNIICFSIFAILFIALVVLKSYFVPILTLEHFYSPVLLPMLIFLFNIFNGINIQSKTINNLASCSLFVYCLHENILLRSIVRPLYYTKVLSICFDAYFGWIVLCGIGMFLGAYILAILYKYTLSRLTNKLSKLFGNAINNFFDKIYSKVFDKENT